MLLTQLNGNINTVSNQVVDMNLNRIDGRPITIFDFTGAGSSGHVVDPSHYMVNIPNSINPPTGNGAALKVRGFVAPFGQATATDDFDASTLINVSTGPADLVVHWPITALVTTPFITFNTSGMVVDLSQSTLVHDVYRSGVDTTLLTTDTPSVNAITPNLGLFVIGYHGAIQVYLRLSDFQSALQARLGAGQYARVFAAHGIYTDTSETMTATGMLVLLR